MQDRIKVVIVDDEPQSIHRLQDDLATLEDFEVIATSSSAVSAKNLVMSIQPDVLFIDVEMPGQTGFEVLQSLRDEIPMDLIVVFYSAFDKYMIDALRASAFDFLLKPYQQDAPPAGDEPAPRGGAAVRYAVKADPWGRAL